MLLILCFGSCISKTAGRAWLVAPVCWMPDGYVDQDICNRSCAKSPDIKPRLLTRRAELSNIDVPTHMGACLLHEVGHIIGNVLVALIS